LIGKVIYGVYKKEVSCNISYTAINIKKNFAIYLLILYKILKGETMDKDLTTHCDRCGKEIKVVKERQDGKLFYMVHGLFCINIPAFFCEKECFEETIRSMKGFDYLDRDDEGRPVVDVDVMINESLLIDRMYDIIYDVDNPLFPSIVFQRLLEMDPENTKFLYATASLYIGMLAAENTPEDLRKQMNVRLDEVVDDLRRLSPEGFERISRLREYHKV
jgi:hypothetical protein